MHDISFPEAREKDTRMNRRRFLAGTLLSLNAIAFADSDWNGSAAEGIFEPGDVQVKTLLPFAGADRVRVEAAFAVVSAAAQEGLELYGRIAPWPTGGSVLWEGPLGKPQGWSSGRAAVVREITGLKPRLWDIHSPHLYSLTVTVTRGRTTVARAMVRFGFRSFVTRDGQFFLNGRRLFLRGNAINPPGRGLAPSVLTNRAFAEAYIRDLKSRNVNLMRIGADGANVWMDACDELGMLVFQGRYGAPPGGSATAPPTDFDASIARYKADYFAAHVRHPSVVINILSNEMPAKGEVGEAFARYFERAYPALQAWDPHRLYIANAGFGRGRNGDINDQHPYEGWYGGTFLSFYRYRATPAQTQPMTLSETVGAYTQSDGRFQIAGKQLAAALTWSGHTATPERDGSAYQAFLAGQIIETFRRMRAINPRLAGIMPFTDIFDHWAGVTGFDQMGPKPVAAQLRTSYQPILLSWELWTPQVYAGSTIHPIAHVVNDADNGSDLTGGTLIVTLTGAADKTIFHKSRLALPLIPYYQSKSFPIALALPASLSAGHYTLRGQIKQGGKTLSVNHVGLFVAASEASPPAAVSGAPPPVDVYDPTGKTARALALLGVAARRVSDIVALPPGRPLIIGEGAWDAAAAKQPEILKTFIEAGGRVLLLRQEPEALAKSTGWLGVNARFASTAGGMWINPERPEHPAFAGIPRERLRFWSDPTRWNQSHAGLPAVAPVTLGFTVTAPEDLGRTAILADFGRGLASIALGEVFAGKGSVLVCGFDLVARARLDPVADRLLRNLISYTGTAAGHDARPLIEQPILWGHYATECGLVGGPQYGLLVNVRGDSADHSTSIGLSRSVSVPDGRRPFGPFHYNGNCHIIDDNPDSPLGSGVFFARLPPGRRLMRTTVRNPEKTIGHLSVEVNGVAAAPVTVAGKKTVTCTTPLGDGATEVAVRYTGTKTLVLLRTEFA